jgi:hypothetical protein
MYRTFHKNENKMINYQDYFSLHHTWETIRALVDAIIPRTPRLAEEFGKIQYYGALDSYTDEYVICTLNNQYYPLAKPVADLLDVAATQLLLTIGSSYSLEYLDNNGKSAFAELSPMNRFRAISLLPGLQSYLSEIPESLGENQDYVLAVINALSRYTLMGYYSEWSGYGSTRLDSPNERILEYFPIGWKQVGYPGPSRGYRALRQ